MRVLGKFEIIEEVGRGGFAVVYKARDPGLDRVVALKVLAPHLTWDPTFADRFRQEAQATAKLKHPNIVVIHEVGQDEEALYIAMEYLPGRTLAQFLAEQGALDLDQALPILDQVASALDYAHGERVLHRDVKPSNVMVQESQGADVRATLTDFGLVKAMEGSQSLTSRGTILGSPHYMAPEQADIKRVHEIGPTTDLYALGLVAYEMLVGQGPFPGDTTSTLVARVQYDPPDPQSIREDLPADVAQVLLKALSRQVKDRYPSAGAMVQALRESVEARKEARQREEKLVQLYQQIEKLVEAEDWRTAEARCREILALDPEYRDVPELWMRVRSGRARQRELEQLYQAAQAASERRSWAEARERCLQIQALEPTYRDVGELLAWAEEELRHEQAADERQAQLAGLYSQAQAALEGKQWEEAVRLCSAIQALNPGYRDVGELLRRAQAGFGEAQAQQEKQEQQKQLAELYKQAQAVSRRKRWEEVQRLCVEIEVLEPGYRDVEALRTRAEKGLAREEARSGPKTPPVEPRDEREAAAATGKEELPFRVEEPRVREQAPAAPESESVPTKKRRRISRRVWVVVGVVGIALVAMCGVMCGVLNALGSKGAEDRALEARLATDGPVLVTATARLDQGAADATGATEDLLDEVMGAGKLVVSTDPDYAPQSFLNEAGELDGFDIDVAQEVAARLGVELELVTPDWDQIVSGYWGGRWDISIGSMMPTISRSEVLWFSDAYYYLPASFTVHADNTTIQTVADLSGKRIGLVRGTTYEDYLNDSLTMMDGVYVYNPPPGIEAVLYNLRIEAIEDLALGDGVRLDAVLDGLDLIRYHIEDGVPLRIVGTPAFYEGLVFALDKSRGPSDRMLTNMNDSIAEMHADGTLTELSLKWYGVDLTTVVEPGG